MVTVQWGSESRAGAVFRAVIAALMVGLAFAPVGSFLPQASAQPADGPARGVNLYFSRHDATNPDAIDALFTDLRAMHVDSVLITYPIYIDSIFGNEIGPKSEGDALHPYASSPTFDDLQVVIDRARAQEFSVWLRPLLDERILGEEIAGGWRGNLSPSDPERFFANYTRMLIELINQVEGVEWLAIGTEFTSLQLPHFDAGWTRMIALLRATPGVPNLFYAMNWHPGDSPVTSPWFGELDGLGIDAYFPVTSLPDDAGAAEIADGLAAWLPRLLEVHNAFPHLPLFVSELGASSSALDPPVFAQPWMSDPEAPIDLDAQARYADAACRFYTVATGPDGVPIVSGLFWWRTSVYPPESPETDSSHEFRGKPAATVIADCYQHWGAPA